MIYPMLPLTKVKATQDQMQLMQERTHVLFETFETYVPVCIIDDCKEHVEQYEEAAEETQEQDSP